MAVTTTQRSRPGSRHPRRRGSRDSGNSQVLGAVLVLGGIGWFLHQTGLVALSAGTMLSCLLIALGVGLVLTARREGGAGLVILGLALTVVLASVSAVDTGLLQRGAGERTFAPTSAAELEQRYNLGVGSLTLDLTKIDEAELAGSRIRAQLGVGELVVLLPPRRDLAVTVLGHAQAGEVNVFNRRSQDDEGTNVVERFVDTPLAEGEHPLDLDLDVGLGTIEVVRPPR